MPMRTPSTTSRATSSSDDIFWSVAGSRYRNRCGALLLGMVELLVRWDRFQESLDDVVRGQTFRACCEVRNDAVAEDRLGNSLDILDRDVEPATQHGACLAGHDQEQTGSGTGSVRQPVVDEQRGVNVLGTSRPHELGCVVKDVIGDRGLPDQLLKLDNLLSMQD